MYNFLLYFKLLFIFFLFFFFFNDTATTEIYTLSLHDALPMLFEALTGCPPFQGDNYPALAHKHIYIMPPRPSSINLLISPAIDQVILTALMKEPAQRYQQASEMAEALERAVLQRRSPPVPTQTPPGGNSYGGSVIVYSCPNCQHLNKPQMRFCTKCGFPLKICPACRSQNPVSNRFCSKCGQALPPTRG